MPTFPWGYSHGITTLGSLFGDSYQDIKGWKKKYLFGYLSRNKCSPWFFITVIGLLDLEYRWQHSHGFIFVGSQHLGVFLRVVIKTSRGEKRSMQLTSWYLPPKKTAKCCDPTNITPWECCHLYSKLSRPIKVIKSHGEHLFLDKTAKCILLFSPLDVLITTPKKTS